ncbi:hypothetical protein [Limnohabitans sp. Jir72]|uniref:hypothetical protein n=1 Tax=Limnohabitans sp. Jir72 TaxID=1977909 RepID=UPI000D3B4A1F|nr:hypothetical protein [Limnohabitans sp. Jir72]PUE31586.1 hypothetical protein B9Z52_11980 [Limnohabitans sp. Jir72]
MKNKTLATWLTFWGGPLGLHRFYLKGFGDILGWLLPVPTAIGIYGIQRAQAFGLDDQLSWVLIPFLGFTIAVCALTAIVYGLMPAEKWNAKFNPQGAADDVAGQTNWLTVFGLATSLLIGTAILMSSLAFSFQMYFEYQIEQAKLISQ